MSEVAVDTELDAIADELYALRPDEFSAARDEKVRQAKGRWPPAAGARARQAAQADAERLAHQPAVARSARGHGAAVRAGQRDDPRPGRSLGPRAARADRSAPTARVGHAAPGGGPCPRGRCRGQRQHLARGAGDAGRRARAARRSRRDPQRPAGQAGVVRWFWHVRVGRAGAGGAAARGHCRRPPHRRRTRRLASPRRT